MAWMRHLKSASAGLAILALGAGGAVAQGTCDTTEFRSEPGQVYLLAETELLTNENPSAALAQLNKLLTMELNCYERGAALRLGAGIKIQNGDYAGAARDLESLLNSGLIPATDRAQTFFQLSQLYLQADERVTALSYYDKWIQAGGQPSRDQMWTLAILNYQMERKAPALQWAEKVFAIDGPGAKRDVYDFLILLYEETGQLGKRAQLLEELLKREPGDKRLWSVIASDYYQSGNERKAFEVQKAMYFAGLLNDEEELMRVVNFYNRFDVPFEAAKMLEKEMNAGRIEKTFDRLELLANLYQVAREYERAIPVIRSAAQLRDSGAMYERLGRSYFEMRNWEEAEKALRTALSKGGLKEPGFAWVLVGQSLYERGERPAAREAFAEAVKFPDGRSGGRGWLDFMNSEDETAKALRVFEVQQEVQTLVNEKQRCRQLEVLGDENAPAGCVTVEERLQVAEERLSAVRGNSES